MKKFIFIISFLAAVLMLGGCPGDTESESEPDPQGPFQVSFELDYEDAPAISSFTIQNVSASGSKWPANPVRLGWAFDGWFSGSDRYDSQTIIKKDVIVTARWSVDLPKMEDQPSADDLEALFAAGLPAALSNSWKIWGHHNALFTQGFGADPTAFEYEGRVYLFASNDSLLYDADGQVANGSYGTGIQGLRAVSSADLVNWTDHGVLNIAGPVSTNPLIPVSNPIIYPGTYASASWAPSATWKMMGGKPQFFIFYANSGNGIGVITSSSPTGPWFSPLNKLLIDRDTPTCAGDEVNYLFDPGVFADDNGEAYLFFGGGPAQGTGNNSASTGQGRRVKLRADMTALEGDPEIFNPPQLFEDSEITKINDKYYYSYVTNGSSSVYNLQNSQIAYMTADHPLGIFSAPRGIMLNASVQLSSDDNNNHHCIFRFKDNYYIAYHASRVKYAMGANRNAGYYRSTHIDNIIVNPDGSIATVTMTSQGVQQVGKFNPYVTNEAESIGIQGGIFTRADADAGNGMVVTAIDSGDWLGVYGVDFGSSGAKRFIARIRSPETPDDYEGGIELRLDPDKDGPAANINTISTTNTAGIKGGKVIGRLKIKAKPGEAGKFTTISIDLNETVTGIHDLVFVFYSSLGPKPITAANMRDSHHSNGFEFDQWQFLP